MISSGYKYHSRLVGQIMQINTRCRIGFFELNEAMTVFLEKYFRQNGHVHLFSCTKDEFNKFDFIICEYKNIKNIEIKNKEKFIILTRKNDLYDCAIKFSQNKIFSYPISFREIQKSISI